jgi:hypothetical protein
VTTGLNSHVFIDGRLARQLTINATRRLQPFKPNPTTVSEDPRHA